MTNRPSLTAAHRRRGALLVMAMVALLIATTLCTLLVRSALQFRRQRGRDGRQIQADWVAEAATIRGLRQAIRNPDYKGEEWTVTLTGSAPGALASIEIDRPHQQVITTVEMEPRGPGSIRSRYVLAIPEAVLRDN